MGSLTFFFNLKNQENDIVILTYTNGNCTWCQKDPETKQQSMYWKTHWPLDEESSAKQVQLKAMLHVFFDFKVVIGFLNKVYCKENSK